MSALPSLFHNLSSFFDGAPILYVPLSARMSARLFVPVSYTKATITAPSLQPYVVLVCMVPENTEENNLESNKLEGRHPR